MRHIDILNFEKELKAKGYKKIESCKSEADDDYEWYRAFRNDGELMYQIFFQFWNFDKYSAGAGWSVSISIMPESCNNHVGRRDLNMSVDWSTNIEKVEKVAEGFYEFITRMDKL